MSNTTATATASKRIKYNFTLNFPSKPFTVKSLTSTGNHPKYITAYTRIQKALAAGTITVVGAKTPVKARRGAREVLYTRADAKTAVPLTSAVEAVTSDLCWLNMVHQKTVDHSFLFLRDQKTNHKITQFCNIVVWEQHKCGWLSESKVGISRHWCVLSSWSGHSREATCAHPRTPNAVVSVRFYDQITAGVGCAANCEENPLKRGCGGAGEATGTIHCQGLCSWFARSKCRLATWEWKNGSQNVWLVIDFYKNSDILFYLWNPKNQTNQNWCVLFAASLANINWFVNAINAALNLLVCKWISWINSLKSENLSSLFIKNHSMFFIGWWRCLKWWRREQ